jgi:hypothetical protein
MDALLRVVYGIEAWGVGWRVARDLHAYTDGYGRPSPVREYWLAGPLGEFAPRDKHVWWISSGHLFERREDAETLVALLALAGDA